MRMSRPEKHRPESSSKYHDNGTFYLDIDLPRNSAVVRTVDSVPLATAEVQQRVSPWTKNMFKLYLLLLVPALWSTQIGYGSTVNSAISNDSRFQNFSSGAPQSMALKFSPSLAQIVGYLAVSPLIDWKGRKAGMFVGAFLVFVFDVLEAWSPTVIAPIIISHLRSGASPILRNSIIIYSLEIAHPSYRGPLIGLLQGFYLIGQIPGTFIPYATIYQETIGDWSWRIPLIGKPFLTLLLFLSVFLLPESPRWLVANDRYKDAHVFLTKYHGEGDSDSPIVRLELEEMTANISSHGSDKRWWDFREVLNTREARYRFFQVLAFQYILGWPGSAAVSYFYPTMLKNTGITDPKTPYLITGIQTPIQWFVSIAGALLTDRIGRRRQLIIGSIAFSIVFAIVAPLNATNIYTDPDGVIHPKSLAQAKAFMAMIFVFGLIFCFCMTPLQILGTVEPLRYDVRAKSLGLSTIFAIPSGWYSDQVTPLALKNIGWKYYLWFVVWNILVAGVVYFFFVETSNRTLEELTEIFRSQYPVRTSLSKSKIVIEGDVIILHEEERAVD